MLIEPNTYIRLIKNCPLDKKYEHTFYFNNVDEQAAHFMSMPGVPFSKQSYQRYSKGVLTVQGTMAQLYNCNYMMFKNESFENKWFYAFVKRVEYVNNITCRVYYEIDVMQTWFFDYELRESLIVREHSVTDNPGDNVVAEHFAINEYVYDWGEKSTPTTYSVDDEGNTSSWTMEDISVVIMYDPGLLNLDKLFGEIDGGKYKQFIIKENFHGGILQGVRFFYLPLSTMSGEDFNDIIGVWNTITDGVIACFCMPTFFIPGVVKNSDSTNYYKELSFTLNINDKFGAFKPKNKKLFTYPYTSAYLTSNRGSNNDFAFEYFAGNSGKAYFNAAGSFGATPGAMAYPINYKGCEKYLDGAVSIPSFPLCTWASNDFVDWVNNNLFSGLGSIVGAVPGFSEFGEMIKDSPTPPTTQLSTITANSVGPYLSRNTPHIMDDIAQFGDELNAHRDETVKEFVRSRFGERGPSIVHGFGVTNVLHGVQGGRSIYAVVKRIREQDARIIDDYFTRYGYSSNRVGIPNRTARPWWSYVKTSGCKISGVISRLPDGDIIVPIYRGVPADDAEKIVGIYDSGITFWNKDADIGAYDKYDNSPVPLE